MYSCRIVRILSVAAAALMLTGCASLNVSSYVERGIDVRQYRTFGWAPTDGLYTGDPRLDNNRFFDERVRTEVEAGLAARGFEKVAMTPDVLIHYHANLTQRVDPGELNSCENDSCRPYVYDAGTLIVDFVDPHTNKVVWRGWAEGGIDGVIDNQAWMEKKVGDAVARILGRLPHRL